MPSVNPIIRDIARGLVLLVVVLVLASTLAGLAGCTGSSSLVLPLDSAMQPADCNQHPQACT